MARSYARDPLGKYRDYGLTVIWLRGPDRPTEFMERTSDPSEDQRENSNGNGGAMLYSNLVNQL